MKKELSNIEKNDKSGGISYNLHKRSKTKTSNKPSNNLRVTDFSKYRKEYANTEEEYYENLSHNDNVTSTELILSPKGIKKRRGATATQPYFAFKQDSKNMDISPHQLIANKMMQFRVV